MRGRSEAGGLKHGLLHAQRLEDGFARVLVERLAAQAVHDFAQQDEIDVAIDEARAGRPGGLFDERAADAGVVAGPGRVQRQVGGQAGKVRHQVAHGDVALAALKFGQVGGDRIVEAELALLEQLHQRGRGGDYFGERRDVEDGVDGHGLALRNQRAVAVGLAMDDLAVVSDDQHRARNQAVAHGCFDHRVERGRCGKGLLRRRCLREQHSDSEPGQLHRARLDNPSSSSASSKSFAVMPPASCVLRSTITWL